MTGVYGLRRLRKITSAIIIRLVHAFSADTRPTDKFVETNEKKKKFLKTRVEYFTVVVIVP